MITRTLKYFRYLTLSIFIFLIHINRGTSQNQQNFIPCRIESDKSPNVHFMTLGDVNTSVSQGIFYPAEDKVILKNGNIINHYFRDSLKVKYYQPLDKSYFTSPPCGWTSWYSYFININTKRIEDVTDFFSKNLRDYGFRYIQIDNGWQIDSANSSAEIWSSYGMRFSPGMDKLASYIHRAGFEAGIWLIPHGSRDELVIHNKDAFIRINKDSIADSDIGRLIDPTREQGGGELKDIMSRIHNWGYTYFKIDGQDYVERMYDSLKKYLYEPNKSGEYYYRKSVEIIKSTVGEHSFLTGSPGPTDCNFGEARGAPFTGMGMMQGSRAHWDLRPIWDGVMVQYYVLMWYYFMHNIAIYVDPDAYFVGEYIPIEHARAWVTLVGLSGMSAFNGDPIEQLSKERIDLIRCITPPAEIRPLDLFARVKRKNILDLKVKHLNREYDLVGMIRNEFNEPKDFSFSWEEMGWSERDRFHVYDFWEKKYLGIYSESASFDVPLKGCRLLTFMRAEYKPQLLSTSRHITQGWIDLKKSEYDESTLTYRGTSQVIANDPYELRFATRYILGGDYKVSNINITGASVSVKTETGLTTVTINSSDTKEIDWEIQFEKPPQLTSEQRLIMDGKHFALKQNNPNPFTTTTNIEVRLMDEPKENISFKIYDVFGREVLDLTHRITSQSSFTIHNSDLPTQGIYFYQFRYGNEIQTKKMILMR